jgi:hypothetical protein
MKKKFPAAVDGSRVNIALTRFDWPGLNPVKIFCKQFILNDLHVIRLSSWAIRIGLTGLTD